MKRNMTKTSIKQDISKSVASESITGPLQLLLHKLSPALNADSLTSFAYRQYGDQCVGPSHKSSSNRSGCVDATKEDHPAHI